MKYYLLLVSTIIVIGCGGYERLKPCPHKQPRVVWNDWDNQYVAQKTTECERFERDGDTNWFTFYYFGPDVWCSKAIGEYRAICSNGGYRYE